MYFLNQHQVTESVNLLAEAVLRRKLEEYKNDADFKYYLQLFLSEVNYDISAFLYLFTRFGLEDIKHSHHYYVLTKNRKWIKYEDFRKIDLDSDQIFQIRITPNTGSRLDEVCFVDDFRKRVMPQECKKEVFVNELLDRVCDIEYALQTLAPGKKIDIWLRANGNHHLVNENLYYELQDDFLEDEIQIKIQSINGNYNSFKPASKDNTELVLLDI